MKLQKLLSYTRQAVQRYHMIDSGDKIAIGISGGKDSLTLLYALQGLRRFYPKPFELVAITVDLGFDSVDTQLPYKDIQDLCDSLNVPFHIVPTQIAQIVFNERQEKNPCSLCAKLRKGALNEMALKLGCNKIALGHHKEDAVNSFMMSLFYEGRLSGFWPTTYLDHTGLFSIRPLIFVPEKDIIGFRRLQKLPVLDSPCPVDKKTKREEIDGIIKEIRHQIPQITDRIFTALDKDFFPKDYSD